MTSYVYDEHTGKVTYILDNNNLYTKFEYDAAGRLTDTYRETFGIRDIHVSNQKYNYAKP